MSYDFVKFSCIFLVIISNLPFYLLSSSRNLIAWIFTGGFLNRFSDFILVFSHLLSFLWFSTGGGYFRGIDLPWSSNPFFEEFISAIIKQKKLFWEIACSLAFPFVWYAALSWEQRIVISNLWSFLGLWIISVCSEFLHCLRMFWSLSFMVKVFFKILAIFASQFILKSEETVSSVYSFWKKLSIHKIYPFSVQFSCF